MAFYILTGDDKGPILYGPYNDWETAQGRSNKIEQQNKEVIELDTRDRTRAARILKERPEVGLKNFQYGNT